MENVATAKRVAVFRCADRLACDKAFALTQVFISTNSDMKIQMANDTIIETFNPTDTFAMGASAIKMPRSGASADILLNINCKSKSRKELNLCLKKSELLYRMYPAFMNENFIR